MSPTHPEHRGWPAAGAHAHRYTQIHTHIHRYTHTDTHTHTPGQCPPFPSCGAARPAEARQAPTAPAAGTGTALRTPGYKYRYRSDAMRIYTAKGELAKLSLWCFFFSFFFLITSMFSGTVPALHGLTARGSRTQRIRTAPHQHGLRR